MSDSRREQEEFNQQTLGCSPADSCLEGIKSSAYVCSINTDDGTPIALAGLVEHPEEEDTAVVWSLSSDYVQRYPMAYVKAMQRLLSEYGGLYSKCISFADSSNEGNMRFHVAIGFVSTSTQVPMEGEDTLFEVFELITTKGLNGLYYA